MRADKESEATTLLDHELVQIVPDEELARLAEEAGASSTAAAMLRELKSSRAKDRQFFAFHIKEHFFVGPLPDARTEADLLAIAALADVAD
jgi:hypothetical protein